MKKILIAEDDRFLANAYRVKLEKAGFEVRITQDGEEATLALKDFLPDLILLDLVMPVKDGFAALKEIRNDPKFKTIPVLVASNLGQQEDIVHAKELGANDFVIKTDLSLEQLVAKINQLC